MAARVETWSMPHTEMVSGVYSLDVAGTAVPVWLSRVREAINEPEGCGWTSMLNGPTDWCSFGRFDIDGPADVCVTVQQCFREVAVLPRSAGITPEVDGKTVRFRIEEPRPLTLCLDGTDEHPLHLFCREIETDRPSPDDPDVVYFGPGEHWVDTIRVRSGQTVYIDGAAILRGVLPPGATGRRGGVLNLVSYGHPVLDLDGVEDVRVCGRGTIDGGCLPHPARNLVRVNNSARVRIDGITLRNSPNWHLPIVNSEDIEVTHVACLSGRLNSDGINCVSSSRVAVRDCFVRSHDDSFVVKTTNPDRVAEDILYERCVAWNDWGYGFGVSYETRADIRDIAFRDCDVIFARNWPLGIHVSDGGTVGPIRFECIGIDYPRTSVKPQMARQCIKLDIVEDVWGKDRRRGHIRDITFADIDIRGEDVPPVLIAGFDAEHVIGDVLCSRLQVNGRRLNSADDPFLQVNEHTRGLRVLP